MLLAAEHGAAALAAVKSLQRRKQYSSQIEGYKIEANREDTLTRGALTKKAAPNVIQKPDTKETAAIFPNGSYFLVIGINDTGDKSGMPPLTGAITDAIQMRETLQDAGFTSLGELHNPTCTEIRKKLGGVKTFLKGCKSARFVLFLAAHGLNVDGEGWVCTSGMDRNNLESSCLEMNAFKDFARRLDCRSQLYLMDCCHAATLTTRSRGAGVTCEFSATSQLAQRALSSSPAIVALCASSSTQSALETTGGGLFTKHLCNGIMLGKQHQFITAAELFSYVIKAVLDDTLSSSGYIQTPCFAPLLLVHKAIPAEGQFLI